MRPEFGSRGTQLKKQMAVSNSEASPNRIKEGLAFHENRLLRRADDSHEIPNIPCPEIKDMVKCVISCIVLGA